jgi:hypothetical protein
MSVDGGTAEVIFATRGLTDQYGKVSAGSLWRYVTAKVSGNRLEFAPRIEEEHFLFDWRDANGGSFASVRDDGGRGRISTSVLFTRLDG